MKGKESKASKQLLQVGLGSPGRKHVPLRGECGQGPHLSHLQQEIIVIWQWQLSIVHRLARQLLRIIILNF